MWGLALVALTLAAALQYERTMPAEIPSQKSVLIGTTTVTVEVVDTLELQTRGLSGRTTLPEGEGMLFIFDELDAPGIWMKDMLISIDIIWAEDDGTIVTIKERVSPDTYPQSFHPDSSRVRYVLEVPAGFVGRHGIAEGMKIVVQ